MSQWDERYGGEEFFYGTEPNEFLRAQLGRFRPGGRLLCLAEGEGRNAVFLAEQGFEVMGVDACAVGLAKAQRLARSRGVKLETVAADLRDFDLGQHVWDGVVSIWCHLPSELRREVHRRCQHGLRAGGVLVLEAYRPEQLQRATGGPKDPDMLPTLEILAQELPELERVLGQEVEREVVEGPGHRGLSSVVQYVGRRS